MWWDMPIPPLPRARDYIATAAVLLIGAGLAWVALVG
jgi:hypothetical protein